MEWSDKLYIREESQLDWRDGRIFVRTRITVCQSFA